MAKDNWNKVGFLWLFFFQVTMHTLWMKGSLLYLSMDQKLLAQFAIQSGNQSMKQKAVMFGKVSVPVRYQWVSAFRGYIKGQAPGKLPGCEDNSVRLVWPSNGKFFSKRSSVVIVLAVCENQLPSCLKCQWNPCYYEGGCHFIMRQKLSNCEFWFHWDQVSSP